MLTGRSVAGSSVNVVAGLAVRVVSVTGVTAGQSSVNAPAAALTGSLNVTVRLASTATPVAFAAGVVAVTDGAASPSPVIGHGRGRAAARERHAVHRAIPRVVDGERHGRRAEALDDRR